MPVASRWAYFDHAAVAPLPAVGKAAFDEWSTDVADNGAVNWAQWRSRVERARELGADLLNASPGEVAVIRNTTEGIGLVAEGFPWREGDNVVTLKSEFPSNRFPWMNLKSRGVETRFVSAPDERLDLDRLAAACDARTRIIAVSWVGYATGWRNDVDAIARLAHERGALLFLDAIQGLGVLPMDVSRTPVDFLAADGHKWLLGPEGAGLMYVRREHLERLRPLGVGWNSVVNSGDFTESAMNLKPSASRYEGGTYNMAGTVAFAAVLEWLHAFGWDRISERLTAVTENIRERLRAIDAEVASDRSDRRRSGILACTLPGRDPQQIRRRCRDRGVIVNCRASRIRISPHIYTNDEDVDRMIEALGA